MSDFEENQNDKSDNEVSDITDNTKLMPSNGKHSKRFKNFNREDIENVEEKINITNNALDQLNELEDPDEVPRILKVRREDDEKDIPLQSDPDNEATYSMPDEYNVKIKPKDENPDQDDNGEPNMRIESELESLQVRNEGDDADSGDNTEDLDPRSEFEKRKEYYEKLTSEINGCLSELEALRNQVTVLEDEEFKMYSAKRMTSTDFDPAERKLEYHKCLCKNVIIKEKMEDQAKIFKENDKQIHAKVKENKKFEKSIKKIDDKISLLKGSLIKRLSEKLNEEFENAKNRKGEIGIIMEENISKLRRIKDKKANRKFKEERN